MKPVSPNAQVGGQRPVNAPEESPPCPSLPHPETNMESGRIGPQQGKERVLAGLAKRVIECFPKEILVGKRLFWADRFYAVPLE